jgi:hypothetical protein
MTMYDVLRARYRFHCPQRPAGELRSVTLSRFRRIERLPGAAHPAVFRVTYQCDCGDDHVGLVAHDDLDYGPIAGEPVVFRNLVTGRMEPIADELLDHARVQVQKGNWPWRLYCGVEGVLKPVFPSSLALVLPAESELVGVAMHCPSCGELSLNVVSEAHLDVPFYHDRIVRLIDRPYGDTRDLTVESFHEQLWSAGFDAEREALQPDSGP